MQRLPHVDALRPRQIALVHYPRARRSTAAPPSSATARPGSRRSTRRAPRPSARAWRPRSPHSPAAARLYRRRRAVVRADRRGRARLQPRAALPQRAAPLRADPAGARAVGRSARRAADGRRLPRAGRTNGEIDRAPQLRRVRFVDVGAARAERRDGVAAIGEGPRPQLGIAEGARRLDRAATSVACAATSRARIAGGRSARAAGVRARRRTAPAATTRRPCRDRRCG